MEKTHPKLHIIQESGFTADFVLDRDLTRIGRSNKADIIINDKAASRLHAEISNLDGECYIQDLESRNGTQLNGQPVREARLGNGDEICIGKTIFRFIDPNAPAEGELDEDDWGDEEWDRFADGKPKTRGEKEKERFLSLPNFLIIGACVVVLGFVLALYKLTETKQVTDRGPIDLPLPAGVMYGFTEHGDRSHPDKAIFRFYLEEKGPKELSYKVWDNDQDREIIILLNGHFLGEPPPTENAMWTPLQVISIPEEYLNEGENLLVFDNLKVPPQQYEFWAVSDVAIGEARRYVCNPDKAWEAYRLGKDYYDSRRISKENLYRATRRLQEALDASRSCSPKPPFYVELTGLYRQATEEYEKTIKQLRFMYAQNAKSKNYEQAQFHLQEILNYCPDPEAEDNLLAVRELRRIQQFMK
jgi:hypothetical protein